MAYLPLPFQNLTNCLLSKLYQQLGLIFPYSHCTTHSIPILEEARDRAPSSCCKSISVGWFPIAFITDRLIIVNHAGFELTTSALTAYTLVPCTLACPLARPLSLLAESHSSRQGIRGHGNLGPHATIIVFVLRNKFVEVGRGRNP